MGDPLLLVPLLGITYIIFCFVNRNERLHKGKEHSNHFLRSKYYLGLASTVQMPGELRPILIGQASVMTSSDEDQLVAIALCPIKIGRDPPGSRQHTSKCSVQMTYKD